MTWQLPVLVTSTISLLILVVAYLTVGWGGRRPSMGLWGLGWALYGLHLLARAGVWLAPSSVAWSFVLYAALGASSFTLWAGTRAFTGRPPSARIYLWELFPVAWALMLFVPFGEMVVAVPIMLFAIVMDLCTAGALLHHARGMGGVVSPWALGMTYSAWAGLKVAHLLLPSSSAISVVGLLALNGLALSLAFALIALSLVEAERHARRRADRLDALAALVGVVGRTASPEGLLESAVEEVSRLLDVEGGVGAFLVEEEGKRFKMVTGRDLPSACQVEESTRWPTDCPGAQAVASGQVVWARGKQRLDGCDINLAIPLVVRNQVLGLLCAMLPAGRVLSEGERRTLTTLGHQLGALLENARLVEVMEREVRHLRVLTDTSRRMVAGADLQVSMKEIVAAARQALGVDRAAVYLYNLDAGTVGIGYSEGLSQTYLDFVASNLLQKHRQRLLEDRDLVWVEDVLQASESVIQEAARAEGFRSMLVLPLRHRQKLLGALALYHDTVRTYSAEDRQFCRGLADQAAMAIQDALLYREAQRRLSELTALHEVDLQITSALDLEQVLTTIGEQLQHTLGVSTLYIGLYEEERDELDLRVIVDNGQARPPVNIKMAGGGLSGWVIRTGEPLWVDDLVEEKDRLPVEAVRLGDPTRSLAVLPLLAKGRVVGVLSVQSYEPHAFDQSDRRIVSEIAAQAAIAIENARLYEAERRARELAERLWETALLVGSSLETREVLESILDQLARVLPYDSGAIHILQPGATCVVAVRNLPPEEIGHVYPLDEYPYNRRLAEGEGPIVIRDVRENDVGWTMVRGLERVRANIGVSLRVRDRVLGALTIDSYEPRVYTEADARVVQTFAQQAAIALENARLYAEQKRHVEEADILLEVAAAISSTLNLDGILKEVSLHVARACKANRCTIFMLDEAAEKLIPRMSQFASGKTDCELWRIFKQASYPRRVEDIPEVSGVVQSFHPLFVPDVSASSLPREWLEPFGVGSLLIVPMISHERVVGLMMVDRPQVGLPFTTGQVNLALAIGGQAAVAIENARLYQETARRLAEAQVMREVMLAAASTLDFDQVLERTVGTLQETMQVEFLIFAFPNDEGTGLLLHPAQIGFPPAVEDFVLPFDGSICGRVFQTGEPVLVEDVSQEDDYYTGAPEVRSELAVPVGVGDRVFGVLNVESCRPNAFDEESLTFYTALASQLSVALENASLYRQERERRREAETLYRAAQALTTSLDLGEVLDRILVELQEVVPYDSASIQLLEEGVLRFIKGRGFPAAVDLDGLTIDPTSPDTPNGRVIQGRAPVILDDAPVLYPEFRREPHAMVNVRSWLGVPLLFGDRLIGILTLDRQEPGFYRPEHANLALAFAGQAAIAIENARLYRQLEEQSSRLRGAVRELQDLDRLRNEVVQNVGHELRTPLTLIQGYTEFMLSGDLGEIRPAQRSALEVIHERTLTLSRLIHNLTSLRSFPRGTLDLMPLSIQDVVMHVLEEYRSTAERMGDILEINLPAKPLFVLGDQEYLGLAFSHLVDNAIKFSPNGGRVRILVSADEDWVSVIVQDEGIGIASEHLERIFERFYQVDGSTTRRFGGMGIGLALVWEIIEAHGGTVMVESELGRGSTFTVVLPRVRG